MRPIQAGPWVGRGEGRGVSAAGRQPGVPLTSMVRMGSGMMGPLPAVMSKGMFMPARRMGGRGGRGGGLESFWAAMPGAGAASELGRRNSTGAGRAGCKAKRGAPVLGLGAEQKGRKRNVRMTVGWFLCR